MSQFREEIGEQPAVAQRLLQEGPAPARSIAARIREAAPSGFLIAARGSSHHAALYAKYLFGARNRVSVALAAPSLCTQYARPPRLVGQCVIGISQSGESPDVVAVVEEGRRQGCLTVAITNDVVSALARAAELVLPLAAGRERSIPASKTYTATLLALALISLAMDEEPEFESALRLLPEAISRTIGRSSEMDALVPELMGPRVVVLGRGFNLATAEEVALKLIETSYILARAWSFAEFEHGPISLMEAELPVVVVEGGGVLAASIASVKRRLQAQGCPVLSLADASGLPEELTPITLAVLGQLLADRLSVARGFDPDRPRTIDKVIRTW